MKTWCRRVQNWRNFCPTELVNFIWLKNYSTFYHYSDIKFDCDIRGLLCWECPNDWGITDYSGSSGRGIWLDPLPLSNTLPPNYRIVKYAKHNERSMWLKHTISSSLFRWHTDQTESTVLRIRFKIMFRKQKRLVSIGFKVVCWRRRRSQK